jgi:hypothetical protein
MTTDQQLASLRQIKQLQRMLQIHERILLAIIAIQLINLIVGLSRL